MGKTELPVWVLPTYEDAADNVWVLLVETKSVRSLRVFRHEPPKELVEYNRQAFEEKLDEPVTVHVHEVAVDFFDDDEIENAGC